MVDSLRSSDGRCYDGRSFKGISFYFYIGEILEGVGRQIFGPKKRGLIEHAFPPWLHSACEIISLV